MKKLFLLLAWAGMLCSTSCSESYDDSALARRVDDLENRVARLEELCKQMNTNIASLQTLVSAAQAHDCITSVVPVEKDGTVIGYTITFSQNGPITIYHGTDGRDGIPPVIGAKQDTDGVYYWTIGDEWLTDETGAKIRTQGPNGSDGQPGTDGKDGITPQLKIENDYWYVSTDNGATWTQLGKATGENGKDGADSSDSIFKSITQDADYIYFALKNGENIVMPKKQQLAITFAEGNSLQFDINETKTVNYTITGGGTSNVVKAEMQNLDGNYTLYTTATSATQGTIKITTKIPTANNVIVSVSNGSQTIMTAIAVSIKPSLEDNVITVETPGTLSELLTDYDKSSITELTVIGNLNSLDISSLRSLPNLAILDIENCNLEALRNFEFQNKTSLTSVKLPRTLKTIGERAFYKCSGLTSITIPESVTSIGIEAFYDCNSLTDVYITDIAKWCAINCSSKPQSYALYLNGELVTELVIPDSVTKIKNGFSDCKSLTSVTIPNSMTTISGYAFRSCSGLTSVTIPNSVTEIGSYAFSACKSLTSVTIPGSVTKIGSSAFGGCSSLTSITIPDSVTEIGINAFGNCSGLTSITIGNSVTSIGNNAFYNCNSLTSIYCKAQTPPTIGNLTFAYMSYTLYVPTGCKEAYATAKWMNAKEIIEIEF